jgi:hypothetical protein
MRIRTGVKLIIPSALVFLGFCASTGPKRALTDKEKAVVIKTASQEVSLNLQARCKPLGKVESFGYMDDARIRTIELSANTAQVIYVTDYNGVKTYDVRFWQCS